MKVMHPRPNPIIAAMYTLRDMDVDVIVIHGPAGCGFMASRMLEEAGVRVVTSSINESDLVFGAAQPLIDTLKSVKEKFNPKTVAIVGTCASMIIGEDMKAAIKRANIGCNVFAVDCHGCMGDNTEGAVRAVEAGMVVGILSKDETARQVKVMRAATTMEKKVGMAGKEYLSPVKGPTKMKVAKMIIEALRDGKKVAVVMVVKKELSYRFADLFLAMDEAKKVVGGNTFYAANFDSQIGLPRIRRYADDVLTDMRSKGVTLDVIKGGLDEYAIIGDEMKAEVDRFAPDLLILAGIPHAYPGYSPDDILITDQPRQLANYLNMGCSFAVGEISSHSMVMNARKIIPLETGETIRELLEEYR